MGVLNSDSCWCNDTHDPRPEWGCGATFFCSIGNDDCVGYVCANVNVNVNYARMIIYALSWSSSLWKALSPSASASSGGASRTSVTSGT